MSIRRMRSWIDERGEQYDEDFYTYNFVPGATSDNGISGTLAPGATATAQIMVEQDSAFEWALSTATATDNTTEAQYYNPNISIQVTDSATGRNLFSDQTPLALVSGYGTFPHVLPFKRRFMPKSTVTVTFKNFDTATTFKLIQFSMIGRKIFMRAGGRPIERYRTLPKMSKEVSQREGRSIVLCEDYFVYHFPFGALVAGGAGVAGATVQKSELVESDSDFECHYLSGVNWNSLATGQYTYTSPGNLVTFNIKDGGSQRHLQNTPSFMYPDSGSAGLPIILPVPRIFLAQTSIIITAINQAAVQNVAGCDMALAGRKIFELTE